MAHTSDPALRALTGKQEEMADLQRVLQGAPRYSTLLTGGPPGPSESQSVFTILPEGKSYDDKFVLGIDVGGRMVGCIDVIRGHPDACTAHVGLLLIAEEFEGRGIGRAAYQQLEALVLSWNTCSRMRLGVVQSNSRALHFWSKLGFVRSGETKPYSSGSIRSQIVIFIKALPIAPRPYAH